MSKQTKQIELTVSEQEQLNVGMPVEKRGEDGILRKIIPSLTSSQSRKRNKELSRIRKFGYGV